MSIRTNFFLLREVDGPHHNQLAWEVGSIVWGSMSWADQRGGRGYSSIISYISQDFCEKNMYKKMLVLESMSPCKWC